MSPQPFREQSDGLVDGDVDRLGKDVKEERELASGKPALPPYLSPSPHWFECFLGCGCYRNSAALM